jgi:pyruvate formate lyase activating enzyme
MQKLTLLDYPGKIAATLFAGGCNFRCPFCHNADLVTHLDKIEPMRSEEVMAFLEKRKYTLEGICLTGGEPLLQPDVADFLAMLKAMGYSVKLDTNGSSPKKLKEILDAGLVDYVAMDIKNSLQKYSQTIGLAIFDIGDIIESVQILMEGAVPYEFRTTVVRELHDESDFRAIGEWLCGARQYFLQPFLDSPHVICPGFHAPEPEALDAYMAILKRTIPNVAVRGV